MISLVQKTKSERKTFTLPNYIVKELEQYASDFGKKQSQVIALALEEFLARRKNKTAKRLKSLDALVGLADKGSLKDLDLKNLRSDRLHDV